MDLVKLFGSRARVLVLKEFFKVGEGAEISIRGMARRIDMLSNSSMRELANLESLGILKSRKTDREKLYSLRSSTVIDLLYKIFAEKFDLPE